MCRSSTAAFRNGSPNWDLPSQLLPVAPRLAGVRVMPVFVATGAPSTYSVPVPPARVTATWVHWFTGSRAVPLIRCSPPLPAVLIANLGADDARGQRHVLTVAVELHRVAEPSRRTADRRGGGSGLAHFLVQGVLALAERGHPVVQLVLEGGLARARVRQRQEAQEMPGVVAAQVAGRGLPAARWLG